MNACELLHGLSRAALGVLRYLLTLALFCAVWWYDARYLNRAFDANLSLVKTASGLVDGSGKIEAMLRAFSAEKMLLFAECGAVVWALGRAISLLGRRFIHLLREAAPSAVGSPTPAVPPRRVERAAH